MSLVTPRILPSHLQHFSPAERPVTTTVRMLGIITTVHGDTATLTSCNQETVTLLLNRDSHLSLQSMYEIVGKVTELSGGQGLGLKVLSSTEWPRGPNGQMPDLNLFAAVVDATHRYRDIFYEGGNEGGEGADGVY